jgi:hypothetical protein
MSIEELAKHMSKEIDSLDFPSWYNDLSKSLSFLAKQNYGMSNLGITSIANALQEQAKITNSAKTLDFITKQNIDFQNLGIFSLSKILQEQVQKTASINNSLLDQIGWINKLQQPNSLQNILNPTQSLFYKLSMQNLANIQVNKIGSLLNISHDITSQLTNNFKTYTDNYSSLLNSFDNFQTLFPGNKFITELPTISYYTETNYIKSISIFDQEEAEFERVPVSEIEYILNELGSDLLQMWQGAEQAFYTSNPDKIRHTLISLRELFTQILHRFAPDDEIAKWSNSPDLLDNGKYTRRARMEFILREIKSNEFNDFFKADISSILKCNEILQRVHQSNTVLSDKQIRAIFIRLETSIRLIFETLSM